MNIERLKKLDKLMDRFVILTMWLIMVFSACLLTYFLFTSVLPCRNLFSVILSIGLIYVIYDLGKTSVQCLPWKSAFWK